MARLLPLLVAVLAAGCSMPSGFGDEGARLAEMGEMMAIPSDLGDGWELLPARLIPGLPGLAPYGLNGNPDFIRPPESSAGAPLQVGAAAYAMASNPGGEGILALALRFGSPEAAQAFAHGVPCEGAQASKGELVARLLPVALDGNAIRTELARAAAERAQSALANRTQATVVPCPAEGAGWLAWHPDGVGASGTASTTTTGWPPPSTWCEPGGRGKDCTMTSHGGPSTVEPETTHSGTASAGSSSSLPPPRNPAPSPCPPGSPRLTFADPNDPAMLDDFAIGPPEAYADDPRASSPGMLYLESGRQAVELPGPVFPDDGRDLDTPANFTKFGRPASETEGMRVSFANGVALHLTISDWEDEVALAMVVLERCDGEVRSTLVLAGVGSGITWEMRAWMERDGARGEAVDLPVVEAR